jgi:diadenosine tetraphosphate (Ap4A) HIT family hydrolase
VRDNYPVTQLHTLVIPKRHAKKMMNKDVSVSGFNIGINSGDTAGQTIAHAHVHLIPVAKATCKTREAA